MTVYVEEFLFRGRPEGSEDPPAWHVVLGEASTDAFGRPVIAEINAVALAQVAALEAQVATLEAQLAALQPS